MAGLSISDLGKRNNWDLFKKKIESGLPFETVDKKEIILGHKTKTANDEFVKEIKKISLSSLPTSIFMVGRSLSFPTKTGDNILISKIQKTREFGSAGNTTAKEDKALSELRDCISEEKKKTGLIELPFKVRGRTFMVYDAISTPGTPKSDFHFVDKNGKEVYWMSHKDGKSEKDFQQWGGISEKEVNANKHKETQDFISKCVALFGDKIPNATTYAMKISDNKLKNIAVYGDEFGKELGRQNVDICLQGKVSLIKSGSFYQVTADAHVSHNGDAQHGGYEPVFMIIYKGDRTQFGIGGARMTISPAGCRKVTKWMN